MSDRSAEVKRIPIMDGLFTWPSDQPRLIAGRCRSCGTYFFPKFLVTHHPDCQQREVDEVLLSTKGTLDTFTIQRFPPPPPFISPDPFVPYAIGWVALPEGIAIAGILTGCDLDAIKLHMELELVIEKAWIDKDGNEALTWKWRPV